MTEPSIRLPEYARTIGVELDHWDGARPVLRLDYAGELSGHPGMFHGGVIAAALDMAALATLEAALRPERAATKLSPVSSTIEYLRPAGEARTFVSARIVRSGRRLANVQATLWQESETKPVATAIVNLEIA